MLRKLLALVVGVAALSVAAVAADAKKDDVKTLEGKLVCTKCTLDETPKCSHALKVKEGDKDVVYYVEDKNKDHKKVCPAGTELDAKVTGKVVEKKETKDGKEVTKLVIQSPKVEFVSK